MTTPVPDLLRWDAKQGRLLIAEALLQPLMWPELLKLERSADGLILTAWDGQESTEGKLLCSVTYDNEEEDNALPYLAIRRRTGPDVGPPEW